MTDRATLLADLDRCNREIAEMQQREDRHTSPAILSAMGQQDWEWEKRRVMGELESLDA